MGVGQLLEIYAGFAKVAATCPYINRASLGPGRS